MTRVDEHESTAATRATCPPDERIANNTRALDQSHAFSAASNERHDIDVPMQLPTPPPQDAPAHALPSPESHTKPESARIEAPNRDIPTPMTATDDGADEQRASQTSPLSANAPSPTSLLASHLSSPFPAQRVCGLQMPCSTHCVANEDYSSFPIAPPRSSDPAVASEEAKRPIANSTRSKSR